jgi:hypothetical protein
MIFKKCEGMVVVICSGVARDYGHSVRYKLLHKAKILTV